VRAHAAEALGTFALVYVGSGAIAVAVRTSELGHLGVALAFGLAIGVMIYALGHIGGAHFDVGGQFPWPRAASYQGSAPDP
jgi:glycerol uptake facilitator-like aquaporin